MRLIQRVAYFITLVCVCSSAFGDSAGRLSAYGNGSLAILSDGRLGESTLNNNPSHPIASTAGFFAIHIDDGERRQSFGAFTGQESGVSGLRFEGSYPHSTIQLIDDELPLDVSIEAISPFPLDDDKRASTPAFVFRISVTNPLDRAVTVRPAIAWRNSIGDGGALEPISLAGKAIHESFRDGDLRGIHFRFEPDDASDMEMNAVGETLIAVDAERNDTLSYLPIWTQSDPQPFFNWLAADSGEDSFEATTEPSLPDDRPWAGLAVEREIEADASEEFVFVLAWRFPHWFGADGAERELQGARDWKSAADAADEAAGRWPRWLEDAQDWKAPFSGAALDGHLSDAYFNGLGAMLGRTVRFRGEEPVLLTLDERFPGNTASPEELLLAAPTLLDARPELWLSQMRRFSVVQIADGEMPSAAGNVYSRLGAGDVPGGFLGRPDSASAFALAAYVGYMQTADRDWLDEMTPHMRAAIVWLARSAEEPTLFPLGPSLTPHLNRGAVNAASVDLYLAAMRLGEEIGQWTGELEFQSICRNTWRLASERALQLLWNGRSVIEQFSSAKTGLNRNGSLPGSAVLQWLGWPLPLGHERVYSHWRETLISESNHGGWPIAMNAASALYAGLASEWNRTAREDSNVSGPWFEAGAGWAVSALNSAAYDPQRACFIAGSAETGPDNEALIYPFSSGGFRGVIRYRRSHETGQSACDITFQSVPKHDRLRQAAIRVPAMHSPDGYVLRALSKGEAVDGQDFTRGALRVFEFAFPLSVDEGDTLTLAMAPATAGRLHINLDRKTAQSLGARVNVDAVGAAGSSMAFRVKNELPIPQIVFLESLGEAPADSVASLNGTRIALPGGAEQALPLLLNAGSLDLSVQRRLERAQWACAEAALLLARDSRPNTELANRLWSLQERVEEALMLDGEDRGFVLQIGPSEEMDESPSSRRASRESLAKRAEDAFEAQNELLDDLVKLSSDPVEAALIAGYFAPIDIRTIAQPAPPEQKPFDVAIRSVFPANEEIDLRAAVAPPEGWRVDAKGPIGLTDEMKSEGEGLFELTLQPAIDLWQRRVSIPVTLTGAWSQRPIRRQVELHVGHSFIKRWMTLGPLPNRRGEAFANPMEPETNIQLNEPYPGLNGPAAWSPNAFENGFVDLQSIYQPGDAAAAYAYVSVFSPRERPARIEFGAAGDAKVFQNYQELFARRHLTRPRPAAELIYFKLNQGWNHILVKLSQREGQWGFYFEIADVDGAPLPDLLYALDKA